MEGGVATAVAALLIALLGCAVLRRLHPEDENRPSVAIGDRVFCGLLAMPTMSVLVHLVFPSADVRWKIVAALPVLVYVILLWRTEKKNSFVTENFTILLITLIVVLYVCLAILLWLADI